MHIFIPPVKFPAETTFGYGAGSVAQGKELVLKVNDQSEHNEVEEPN